MGAAKLTRRPRAAAAVASEACPKGHLWYDCAASRFAGCCSIDPCALGAAAAAGCPSANQPVATASSSVATTTGAAAAAPLAPSVTIISPSLLSTESVFIPAHQSTVSLTVTFTAPISSSGPSSVTGVSVPTAPPGASGAPTLSPSQTSPAAAAAAAAGVAASNSSAPFFTAGVIAVVTLGLVALLGTAVALVSLLWWRANSSKMARARARSSSSGGGGGGGHDVDNEEEAIETRTDGLYPRAPKSRCQPCQPRSHARHQRPDDNDTAAMRPISRRSSGATMPATPLARPSPPWREGFPTAGGECFWQGSSCPRALLFIPPQQSPLAPFWRFVFNSSSLHPGRISDRADSLRDERLLAGADADANAIDTRWSLSDLATVSTPRRHSSSFNNIYTPRGRQSLSPVPHTPSRGVHPQCAWRQLPRALVATSGGGGGRGATDTTTTTTLTSRPSRAYSCGGGGGGGCYHNDVAPSPVGHQQHHRHHHNHSIGDQVIKTPLPASDITRELDSRSTPRPSDRDPPDSDGDNDTSGGGGDGADGGSGSSSRRRRRRPDSDAESVLLTIPIPGYAELGAADCYHELTPPPRRRPQSAESEGEGQQEQQQGRRRPGRQQQQEQREVEELGAGADEGRVSRSSRLSLSGVSQRFVPRGVEEIDKRGEETVAEET